MRVIGVLLIVVALAIALVPSFTNCAAEGVEGGNMMKCFWTSKASLALGVTLGVVGLLLAVSKRKETQLFLSVTAGVLSAFAALMPTTLIGVCGMDKLCRTVERPTLVFAGVVGVALSIAGFVIAMRRIDAESPDSTSTPSAGAAA